MHDLTTSPPAASRPAAGTPRDRRWLAAAVMMAAALMDLVDVTIVNVALPTIHRDLVTSGTALEWVVSAYMLAFAATLITAGSFGDLLGRRRVFLVGIAAFGAASLAAGVAQTSAELIGARVVQGAAAAAMTPQVLATFRAIFTGRERGRAFGIYGAVLGFASAVGLVLGGLLTQADLFGWGWRTVFLVNLPIAVLSFAGTLAFVPETREPSARRPDLVGAALLTAALVAIVYPLLEGRSRGWPAWTWPVMAAGVVALAGLGRREVRRRDDRVAPLLRPELLRIPAFAAGLVVQLAFSAGLQGFFVVFAVWLQSGQGFSPLRAGVTGLAFSVGSFLLAPVAIPLAVRFGRLVLVTGAALLAAGAASVDVGARHVHGLGAWPLVPGLVVAGAGLALLVIPLVNVVLAGVPAAAAGGASGSFSTAQQLGGALGVAVAGTVFFGHAAGHPLRAAFERTAPWVVGAFVVCAVLCLALPGTAVGEEELVEA